MSIVETKPPQIWTEVCEAFGAVLESTAEDRARLLAALPGPVRTEVEGLIRAHERAGRFIEPEMDDAIAPGERFGPYRIVELIAKGGMGEVYRASRDDGEFDQQVALKVLSGLLASRDAERMFLRERQILAGLSHPNIVKLLDGGVSDGRRYFVMEWIDGQPLLEACRALGLDARLRLFREICAAIHTAHQQLIVHRDLKPANVLVDGDGHAKVLDFGIAKLLDLGESGVGRTQLRAMTLAYASPEQARGLNAGIPSDIYSLGLLLWEMLTFERVQQVDSLPLDEAIRRIADDSPTRPAALPRDLASVALKAMAKEPERRYASAQELGDDVARYLGGYPVRAQRSSFGYLARKFVARNRTAVIIVTIAVAALLWQFIEVQRQRHLAERRFAAARQMAQVLIFEAPAQLSSISATLETRKMMVQRATTYLESLAQDVRGDQEFALSVARAYRQTAYTQFNNDGPNLNDPRGALQSLERGGALLERTGLRTPPVLRELIENRLARPYNQMGLREDSLRNEEELDRLGGSFNEPVLASRIRSLKARNVARPPAERLEHLLALRAAYALDMNEAVRLRNLALMEKYLINVYAELGRREEGLASARRALEIDETRLRSNPRDRAMRLDVSFDYSQLGTTLHELGRTSEAIPHLESALAIRRELVGEDPGDKRAQDRLAWILGELGRVHFEAHHHQDALRHLTEALALRRLAGGASQQTQTEADLNRRLAQVHDVLGQPAQACIFWQDAARALPTDPRVDVSKYLEPKVIRARAAACAGSGVR